MTLTEQDLHLLRFLAPGPRSFAACALEVAPKRVTHKDEIERWGSRALHRLLDVGLAYSGPGGYGITQAGREALRGGRLELHDHQS